MNGALSPLQKRAHSRPVELGHTRRIDGYLVGTLRDAPPPLQLQKTFDTVHRQLDTTLAGLTRTLPLSGKRDSMIATYLCMAVKLTVPQRLNNKSLSSQDQILLDPTIWIECHNEKWIKPISRSLSRLDWLIDFVKHQQLLGMPHISPNGPHPLAMELPWSLEISTHSFAIQDNPSHSSTVCGARARFKTETSDGTIECYSTIGGLIYVNDQLFAMTTAHAFVAHALESPQSTRSESTEPNLDAHSPTAPHSNNWTETRFPTTFAYLGEVYVRGSRVDEPIVGASDFALIDPASFDVLSNIYHDTNRKVADTVSSIEKISELCAGPVWIITSLRDDPDEGYMVEGNASIIVKGVVMPTKMIQVTMTPDLGLSGSWVVQEGKLLGVIYAGNASSSYLHMLPAETVLKDVKRVVNSDTVRVATAQDISEYEARRRSRRSKDQDVFASTLPRERHSAVLTEHLSESSRSERASADEPAHSRPTYTDDVYWRPSPETPRARETFLSPEYLPYGITVASQGRGDFEQGRGDFEQDRGDFEYGRGDRSKSDDESPADEAKSSAAYDLQFGTGRYF